MMTKRVIRLSNRARTQIREKTQTHLDQAAMSVLAAEHGTWARAFKMLEYFESVMATAKQVVIDPSSASIYEYMANELTRAAASEKRGFSISSTTVRSDVTAASWALYRPSIQHMASLSCIKRYSGMASSANVTQRKIILSMIADQASDREIRKFIAETIEPPIRRHPDWVVPFSVLETSVASARRDGKRIGEMYRAVGQIHSMNLKADTLRIDVYRGSEKVSSFTAYNPEGAGPR